MSIREKIRIMVVDDMSTSRGLLVQTLENLGVRQIDTASDGAEALRKIQAAPVHLVVSDMNMPGMSGIDLLRHLRAGPATNRVGFLLVTGKLDQNTAAMARKFGANNVIKKPFSGSDLKEAIEKIVGRL